MTTATSAASIPTRTLAITAAAQAAYARNPIPEDPRQRVPGRAAVCMFAVTASRGSYNADKNNIQPRLGFAYQVNDKTVAPRRLGDLHGAGAVRRSGIYQPGFSQATNIVPSLDTGVTIRATLANPFPEGVLRPPGNSLGVNTFLGRTIGRFNDDLDFKNGQAMRWSFSMQRELPGQWVVEGAYVGKPRATI